MVTVEYSKLKRSMYVKTGKGKEREYTMYSNEVNATALFYIKKYFEETITQICNERINTYSHIIYNDGCRKTEFFMKLKCSVSKALMYPTWENYLVTCLRNLRLYAPHAGSRYFRNYMERIEMMESVLLKYAKTDKYYTERNEQMMFHLFDNQRVMNYC